MTALRPCFLVLALLCAQGACAQQSGGFDTIAAAAAKAQDAGNNEEAVADYTRALAFHPEWPEGLWALGNLDYTLDRYPEAITALTRLAALAPNSGAALSMLGLSEFEAAAYPAAREHLQKAHDLNNTGDPGITRVADYHLALLLNRAAEFDRAIVLLHATFPQSEPPAQARTAMGIALLHIPLLPSEIDPAHDALLQAAGQAAAAQDDPQKSASLLASLIQQHPQTPGLHEAYARALAAMGQNQQTQAAKQQEAKLASTGIADLYRLRSGNSTAAPPAASDSVWQQAMQDYSSHNYPQTIAALKLWVQQKPEDGTAWAVMGLSEFELKDYENARIHLERGQQLGLGASRQAAAFAAYHLALLVDRTGGFDAASVLLAPIADYQPMAADVRFALGLALLRMPVLPSAVQPAKRPLVEAAGRIASLLLASKYDEAFPLFKSLLAQYPGTPWLRYAYGTALESLSQYDEAKVQMQEELKLPSQSNSSTQSALPWVRLASIALKQHLPAEALPAGRTAVRLAPESADAHYVLGRAQLDQGDATDAIPELEKAVSLAPNSPEPHFALARAYTKANMPEKAQQERGAFARINELAEQQRAAHGDQSYKGPREAPILNSGSSTSQPAPQQP